MMWIGKLVIVIVVVDKSNFVLEFLVICCIWLVGIDKFIGM